MSTIPTEVELRLKAPPKVLARIANTAPIQALQLTKGGTEQLVSIYWDTPSLGLRGAGCAVRLRDTAGGCIQTVKTETGAIGVRQEFETPCPGDRPRLALAVDQGWKPKRAVLALENNLVPVFSTQVKRRRHTVTFADGTVAELALDTGVVAVMGISAKREDISEVELELKNGDIRRLYELAFALVKALPSLLLQFSSKSDRGYQLVTGSLAAPRHARAIERAGKHKGKLLAVRAASEALLQVARNLDGVRLNADPDYVHQMRIGIRRLRVTSQIARAADLPVFSDKLAAELKWLWNTLGSARDLDVFELETWPRAKRNQQNPHTDAFESRIRTSRAGSHHLLRRALDGRRFQKAMLALIWVIANQHSEAIAVPERGSARSIGRKVLGKQLARLLHNGSSIEALPSDRRHRLRIDAKKLRYQAEFFAPLYPKHAVAGFLQRLARVQTALGDFNDVRVIPTLMQSLLPEVTEERTFIVGLWDDYAAASEAALEPKLERAWSRFVKTTPFWQ